MSTCKAARESPYFDNDANNKHHQYSPNMQYHAKDVLVTFHLQLRLENKCNKNHVVMATVCQLVPK